MKRSAVAAGLLTVLLTAGVAAAQTGAPPTRVPNMTFEYLPSGAPKAKVSTFPIFRVVGKKPIVFLYIKPGHAASETELQVFHTMSQQFKGKAAFYVVAKATKPAEKKAAIAKARALKLKLPLLLDRNQLTPYMEAWWQFPKYALVDKQGYFRVTNAASFNEAVGTGMTLLKALKQAVAGKPFAGVWRGVAKSVNSYALAGKKFPDVALDDPSGKPKVLSAYFKKGRPLVVGFWSVTCHVCKPVFTEVGNWWRARRGNVDMVAITRAPTTWLKNEIKKFQASKGYFPVSYAPENRTLSFFKIVKVPTVILVDRKGIVRHVWIQPNNTRIAGQIEAALVKYGML